MSIGLISNSIERSFYSESAIPFNFQDVIPITAQYRPAIGLPLEHGGTKLPHVPHAQKDLEAHCNPQSVVLWRVMEKIGMRRKALLLKHAFFHRSPAGSPIWIDTYGYALLREDFYA